MQTSSNVVNFGEKDVRQRLAEALTRFGYKQVDVSKETGTHQILIIFLKRKKKEFITLLYHFGSKERSAVT